MNTEILGRGLAPLHQYFRNLPIPYLAAFDGTAMHAPHPVRSGSTTAEVRFQPMPKKTAAKLWRLARDFDEQTHRKGHHGGVVGRSALAVLHALIFGFLNPASGRLDPSYAAIARKARMSERAVATAIQRLKALGILNWVRRCAKRVGDHGYLFEQKTNAYAVLPDSQWRGGYQPPPECPPPAPENWGAAARMPPVLEQAVAKIKAGSGLRPTIAALDLGPKGSLENALSSLGRSIAANEGAKA